MRSDIHAHPASQTLADRVLKRTGVDVARCYQCGKCSAGCLLGQYLKLLTWPAVRSLTSEVQ